MAETIYSRWHPDTGGYDYFTVPGGLNLNDDLPTPDLVPATKIGVPSIEAGRAIPTNASLVGQGPVAVGLVAPCDPQSLVRRTRSLAGYDVSPSSPWCWALVAGIGAAAWLLYQRR